MHHKHLTATWCSARLFLLWLYVWLIPINLYHHHFIGYLEKMCMIGLLMTVPNGCNRRALKTLSPYSNVCESRDRCCSRLTGMRQNWSDGSITSNHHCCSASSGYFHDWQNTNIPFDRLQALRAAIDDLFQTITVEQGKKTGSG